MNIPKISALYESSLASALSAAGTSFTVVSGTDRDGNALSGLYGFIIDEGEASEEFVLGTISGTTVTIVYRGIAADAPNTEVSANKKAHSRGASVKITDYPILGVIRNLIAGLEALPAPLKYAAGIGPVAADDLVDKAYVDALAFGGSFSYDRIVINGNAGVTVAAGDILYLLASDGEWYKADADDAGWSENVILGIAQGAGTDGNAISGGVLLQGLDSHQTGLTNNTKYYLSNTAGAISTSAGTKEVSLGISRSTTSLLFMPRFDQQLNEDQQDAVTNLVQAILPYAADSGSSDTYAITLAPAPTAYTAGMVVHFKANTINTGAATLNVNGLGDKTIVKSYNLPLVNGDIKANQIVSVIYDGTNFQLLSPVTVAPHASGITTRDMTAASGAVTIAHGLGVAPKRIKITATIGTTTKCFGTYDSVNQRVIYEKNSGTGNGNDTGNIIWLEPTANDTQKAVVSMNETNITLTWTKANTPAGTAQILWEAFA